MTRSRSFTGTVTTAVLVVAFGSKWVADWVADTFTGNNVLSYFMHQLTSPAWSLSFSGSDNQLRGTVAQDARAALIVGFVYAFLVAFRKTFPEGFAGLILGWGTVIFSSALAGLIAAFVAPSATATGALQAAALSSIYGLFTGWIPGIIVSIGRNIKIFQGSKASA